MNKQKFANKIKDKTMLELTSKELNRLNKMIEKEFDFHTINNFYIVLMFGETVSNAIRRISSD